MSFLLGLVLFFTSCKFRTFCVMTTEETMLLVADLRLGNILIFKWRHLLSKTIDSTFPLLSEIFGCESVSMIENLFQVLFVVFFFFLAQLIFKYLV